MLSGGHILWLRQLPCNCSGDREVFWKARTSNNKKYEHSNMVTFGSFLARCSFCPVFTHSEIFGALNHKILQYELQGTHLLC